MSTGSPTASIRDRRTGTAAWARVDWSPALPAAPVAVALLLWGVSFRSIDLGRISDFGLLPALPWTFYAALAVLTVGFVLVLRRSRPSEPILALHVATLIVIVHGTPAVAYGTLRYSWAWKHVGIVDYIQRHERIDPNIEFLTAYHNWPGFFALSALYTEVAGFGSALSFASWAPVFFNVAFFGALVVLFRALTTDTRRVWLGVWFFFSANWIGQDYFSPQAFAYFLFLVIMAICLTWFRATVVPEVPAVRRFIPSQWGAAQLARMMGRADTDACWYADAGRRERSAMLVLAVLLVTVIASSHQLTPFMLVLALAGLVLFQRIVLRPLPVLVAVISLGWVTLFAVGFLHGNLYWVVDSLGTLTTNANSTLINLADASHGQRVVALVDRGLTLGFWALGVLGVARLARRGHLDLSACVLALAPFVMLGATSYGGEILFRVYFFALPFFALLAAGLFYPVLSARGSRRGSAALGLLSLVLIGGLLVGYYGKEAQNYFSKDEVRAATHLYDTATPGSLLVAGVNDYPWAFTRYEEFRYLALADLLPNDRRRAIADPAGTINTIAQSLDVPCAYVVITASQTATVNMTGVMPAGSLTTVLRKLEAAPRYRVLSSDRSATVLGVPVGASAARCHLP